LAVSTKNSQQYWHFIAQSFISFLQKGQIILIFYNIKKDTIIPGASEYLRTV
jgi:hypothetical protein